MSTAFHICFVMLIFVDMMNWNCFNVMICMGAVLILYIAEYTFACVDHARACVANFSICINWCWHYNLVNVGCLVKCK